MIALACLAFWGARAEGKTEKLRVMSFNVRIQTSEDTGDRAWEARKEGCVKAIKKYNPDVLGLQDAQTVHKTDIMKELPEYQLVDRSGKPGKVDEVLEYNENPIIFRANRFELLDYGFFWLNEDQTINARGWDASGVRTVNWVKLRCKKSGQIFFYFNTRFDNEGPVSRQQSAALIIDRIKELAGDSAVVFLGGDFCVPNVDKAVKILASYFRESEVTVKKPDTTPSFNDFGRSKGISSDHFFYRNAEASSFEVVSGDKFGVKYISDHYPIVSDFTIVLPKSK